MNLSAYDRVTIYIDKSRSWLNIETQELFSREIANRQYGTFCKRFDPDLKQNVYYIIVLDNPPKDTQFFKIRVDDYGRIKISLRQIWTELGLYRFVRNRNIYIEHVEHTDDGDIYKINV